MIRQGMSLLEVLVAMAILLLGLVGISRLISLSTDRAALVQQESLAALRCQSKLAELIAGVQPLQGGSGTFDDDPAWSWSVTAEPRDDAANLWSVQVRVTRQNEDGSTTENVLSQLVVDPRYRGGSSSAAPAGSENPDTPAGQEDKGKAGGNSKGKDDRGGQRPPGGKGDFPRPGGGKGDFPPPGGKGGFRPPPGFGSGGGFKQ